jgi:hypothetical protein
MDSANGALAQLLGCTQGTYSQTNVSQRLGFMSLNMNVLFQSNA